MVQKWYDKLIPKLYETERDYIDCSSGSILVYGRSYNSRTTYLGITSVLREVCILYCGDESKQYNQTGNRPGIKKKL